MMAAWTLLLVFGSTGQASTDNTAAGWVAVDEAGQCTPTHPPRHRIEVVRDTFKKREDLAAVEDATRARAREALRLSACADRSPAQCDAIQARVGIDVAVDLEQRVVCAAALVSSRVVADPDGQQLHRERVRAAVTELAAALKDTPVGSLDVRWATSCGAGPAGARLAAKLRAGLSSAGVRVTDGTGDRVVAKLTPGDPVVMELWRYADGSGALVSSAQLSPDWLGLYGSVGDQCHDSSSSGMDGGQRPGATGLTVSLVLPIDGALCPGQQVELTVRPSAAAEIQIWSVGRTGEAWLTYSSMERYGAVAQRAHTLVLEAAHIPALGEEKLLVVAAPPGVGLPRAQEGCRVVAMPSLPAEAALASAPFTVQPAGRGRCPAADAGPGVSWADYQSAPVCQ